MNPLPYILKQTKPLALACFVTLVSLGYLSSAQALTLGRLKVISGLGQPLLAEIEVPEITPEEAGSLRVAVGSPGAFKAAGLDYNTAASTLNITGKRHADGRALLELTSPQPINEPFLDLVLEISWATGRLVRDYTILLDTLPNGPNATPQVTSSSLPMQSNGGSAVAPVAPVAPAPVAAVASLSNADKNTAPSLPAGITPETGNSPTGFGVKTQRATRVAADKSNTRRGKGKLVVKKGDTAAALANANRPEGVSLDQMLVAMLRANPQAFADGNVNRLKAGVVLDLPDEQRIRAINRDQARDSIHTQARDFNDYRRKHSTTQQKHPMATIKFYEEST